MAITPIFPGNVYLTTGIVSNGATKSISAIKGVESISSIDGDASTITIATSVNHNVSAGEVIYITGTSAATTKTITSIDGDTGNILITTSASHGLAVNDEIVITGTTNYNNTFLVASVPSATTLTINNPSFNYGSEETGTISISYNGKFTVATASGTSITITSASHNFSAQATGTIINFSKAPTIYVTTSTSHNFIPGQTITISGTTNFNGTFSVGVVTSSTTFTILVPGYTFANETSGTITLGDIITHNANECIKIHLTKGDENYDNQVNPIPVPVGPANQGTDNPYSRVIDIKRIVEGFTIQGELDNEAADPAFLKRANLINLVKNKKELTFVLGTTPYQILWTPNGSNNNNGVSIAKMQFTHTGGYAGDEVTTDPDGGSTAPPETSITVSIQLIRGKGLGT